MKNIFFILLISASCCLIASATDIYTVTKDNINIRADSTISSPAFSSLNKDEKVKIVEKRFDWAKIILPKNSYCYIAEQFTEPLKDNKIKVHASGVNLRSLPSLDAPIIGQCPKGTILPLIKKTNSWLKVRGYPYSFGWINQKFLQKDTKGSSLSIPRLISTLETCSALEKEEIYKKLISAGGKSIQTLENYLENINKDTAYGFIVIFTKIAQKDNNLVPYFIKKINSDNPKIAGIYLDTVQNILYPKHKKTAYFYQAENNDLSGKTILNAKRKFMNKYLQNIELTSKAQKQKTSNLTIKSNQ